MDDNAGGDGIFIRTSEVLRGQNLSQSGPLAKRNYPKQMCIRDRFKGKG